MRLIVACMWLAFAALSLANAAAAKAPGPVSIKKATPVCEIDFAYPETGQRQIDAQIAEWANGLLVDFEASCKEAETDKTMLGPGGKYSAELTYVLKRNDAQYVSVAFNFFTYTGGAHPNTQQYGQTYLRADGRRVFLAELVGPRGIQRLSAFAVRDLKSQQSDMSDSDWIARGAGPFAYNLEDFVLTDDGGMTIMFSPYQVAAYAAGPQEVYVPRTALTPLLRPDPRAPQASFECRRAKTRVERAICNDWRVARADRRMAEDYVYMREVAYEPEIRAKLVREQRDWLKTRNAACERANEPGQCLLPLIETRRTEIAAPRY
jgi:peptidoglycan-N-acetylglucosamine deacetylase